MPPRSMRKRKSMPAPKQNKNAAKPARERAGGHLHLRLTDGEKASYQEAALAAGQTLSAWVKHTLTAAAKDKD